VTGSPGFWAAFFCERLIVKQYSHREIERQSSAHYPSLRPRLPLKEKVRGFIPLGADARYSLGMSLCIVVVVAFVLRMIVVLLVFRTVAAPTLVHNEFGWEMRWTARSIVLGRGFSSPFFPITGPTALVPPPYPYLLAGIQMAFGLYSASSALVILSLNSLLSALTVVPIYFSAKHALNARIPARLSCARADGHS
jgi:hypothetical protein